MARKWTEEQKAKHSQLMKNKKIWSSAQEKINKRRAYKGKRSDAFVDEGDYITVPSATRPITMPYVQFVDGYSQEQRDEHERKYARPKRSQQDESDVVT